MNENERIGIIDIGSNSIRLVIYEHLKGMAFRIIDESKETARLSQQLDAYHNLLPEAVDNLIDTIIHFKKLCEVNGASGIRAVATAAVRSCSNSREVVERLQRESGLRVEIISGVMEARAGYLGMVNAIDIEDGFLIDIGGGSAEISLFRRRECLHSCSIPIGAVGAAKRFSVDGNLNKEAAAALQREVLRLSGTYPWLQKHGGLPLVGLGGTIRNLCKVYQKAYKASLEIIHRCEIKRDDVNEIIERLSGIDLDKRRKVDGLSKSRADIIVPGLVILQTVMRLIGSDRLIVSGAGVREGLLYEAIRPQQPQIKNVIHTGIESLLVQYPLAATPHTKQVNRFAVTLLDALKGEADLSRLHPRADRYMDIASWLFRVGVTVSFYDYKIHTYYLILHSRVLGLTHRETLICALTASYKSKSRLRRLAQEHRDLLRSEDIELIQKLGTLLLLAIALDRSETQPLDTIRPIVDRKKGQLQLGLGGCKDTEIERREAETLMKDFQKAWGLKLKVTDL